MKLINRQTGNNCYEIIKEYKGGFTARMYQTVAFFFNSNLKQPYDRPGRRKGNGGHCSGEWNECTECNEELDSAKANSNTWQQSSQLIDLPNHALWLNNLPQ